MPISSWTRQLGTQQGRLQPLGWTPTQGDYAFVLGSDSVGRRTTLQAGDYVEVTQTGNLGSSTLLRFNARTRGPTRVPQACQVTALAVGLYRLTINGTDFDYTVVNPWDAAGIECGLAAQINASDLPVVAQIVPGPVLTTLQIESTDSTTPTLAVVGNLALGTFSWTASLLVDGTARFSQTIRPGSTRDRWDVGAMVRPEQVIGGNHDVNFRLTLDGSLAGSTADLELPAYYIDDVTLAP